jgi:hypothetical protein
LRAVLEPVCPVPFVAWPGPGLPGWAGSLDLVVVLAPEGRDPATAAAVAEAVRRGCQLVVAAPEASLVASHAQGRYSTVLPTQTGDQLAVAVVVLDLLDRVHLGPQTDPDVIATALDEVAIACGPHGDIAVNPAKILAIGIADSNPIFWGGTVLAARAGRRIAESVRRATGRTALAADAEHLLPVLAARVGLGLPYRWARMRGERVGTTLRYASERLEGATRPRTRIVARRTARVVEGDALADFLTARWAMHVGRASGTRYWRNEHEPWPLFRGELLDLDDELLAAAGFPGLADRAPDSVLVSPGVTTRFSGPSGAGAR